jgi:hypothetical protein
MREGVFASIAAEQKCSFAVVLLTDVILPADEAAAINRQFNASRSGFFTEKAYSPKTIKGKC